MEDTKMLKNIWQMQRWNEKCKGRGEWLAWGLGDSKIFFFSSSAFGCRMSLQGEEKQTWVDEHEKAFTGFGLPTRRALWAFKGLPRDSNIDSNTSAVAASDLTARHKLLNKNSSRRSTRTHLGDTGGFAALSFWLLHISVSWRTLLQLYKYEEQSCSLLCVFMGNACGSVCTLCLATSIHWEWGVCGGGTGDT